MATDLTLEAAVRRAQAQGPHALLQLREFLRTLSQDTDSNTSATTSPSSTASSSSSGSWTTCSSDAEITAHPAAAQSAGTKASWQDHTGNGWAARPSGPPEESVRAAWERGRQDMSDMVLNVSVDVLKAQEDGGNTTNFASTHFRALCVSRVQQVAEEYLQCQMASDAINELFGVRIAQALCADDDDEASRLLSALSGLYDT